MLPNRFRDATRADPPAVDRGCLNRPASSDVGTNMTATGGWCGRRGGGADERRGGRPALASSDGGSGRGVGSGGHLSLHFSDDGRSAVLATDLSDDLGRRPGIDHRQPGSSVGDEGQSAAARDPASVRGPGRAAGVRIRRARHRTTRLFVDDDHPRHLQAHEAGRGRQRGRGDRSQRCRSSRSHPRQRNDDREVEP